MLHLSKERDFCAGKDWYCVRVLSAEIHCSTHPAPQIGLVYTLWVRLCSWWGLDCAVSSPVVFVRGVLGGGGSEKV